MDIIHLKNMLNKSIANREMLDHINEAGIDHAVDLLNDLLSTDCHAINRLAGFWSNCNKGIADHPDILVTMDNKLGILGIINALFPGRYFIAATFDDKNFTRITGFCKRYH